MASTPSDKPAFRPRVPAQAAFSAATPVAFAVAAAAFLQAWWSDPRRPSSPLPTDGWWSGYDQGHYLQSALAFAHGDFSPASHWYLPAYPALGSVFARLTPADPFVIPDLVCLLAALWLMAGLGGDLVPGGGGVGGGTGGEAARIRRLGGLGGMVAFLLCAVALPVALRAWVMPWSSTLAVPLILGCLRATLATLARPGAFWPPVLAGFCGAGVAGCRPVDAVLLLGCAGVFGVWRVFRAGGTGAVLGWVPRFALGVLAGLLPTLCLYLPVWGLHQSPYIVSSAAVGFEWRLLPLHWVELMVSPRPIVPDGAGLMQALPFIGPGLLGLVASVLVSRSATRSGTGREREAHLFVLAAVLSSTLLYLAYRDLHAPGLWQFFNYHYFKWSFGLLGFYALLGAHALVYRRAFRLLWLVPLAAVLVGWRVTPHRSARATGTVTAPNSLAIPVPALGVSDAVVVAAGGPFDPIYFGTHSLQIGGTPILPIRDFKAMPIAGGLMLTPLRPWPAGMLSVVVVPGIVLDPEPAPFVAHIGLRPGLPCWFGLRQSGCDADGLLPPPLLPVSGPNDPAAGGVPGGELRFDGNETRYLGTGWSFAEPGGRWTAATAAELRFRVPPVPGAATRPAEITLRASAIWRQGLEPMDVEMEAGGTALGHFSLADGSTRELSVTVPAALIGADGTVRLWVMIRNPHAPRDIFPPSADVRLLGINVRAVAWRWL